MPKDLSVMKVEFMEARIKIGACISEAMDKNTEKINDLKEEIGAMEVLCHCRPISECSEHYDDAIARCKEELRQRELDYIDLNNMLAWL